MMYVYYKRHRWRNGACVSCRHVDPDDSGVIEIKGMDWPQFSS